MIQDTPLGGSPEGWVTVFHTKAKSSDFPIGIPRNILRMLLPFDNCQQTRFNVELFKNSKPKSK